MRTSKNVLRELIKEMVAEESGGLPKPNDLARKLSAAGPEATITFLSDLMPLLKFGGAPAAKEELPPPPPPEPMPEQKDRRSVLQRLIQEMAAAPQSPAEWMKWGESRGLDAERDGSGQITFYTEDQAMADEAEGAGADVQRDNMGQFVIYTG